MFISGGKWGNMFLGEHRYTVDPKGRMALPPKFRSILKGGAIITRGLDSCLFLFGASEWLVLAKKLKALPLTQSDSRAFTRLMLSGAMDVDIDKQGRILIPDYLRAYAGMKRGAVVIGLVNRVEVWSEERWRTYKGRTEKNSDRIAESLNDLGI